jgi:isopentenyl diphosphate isomerase/L-lactate dehydrogenase-like FMN-dependent dehydrogenase
MSREEKHRRRSPAKNLPTADVLQFEPIARRRLTKMAYDYVRSGGGDEITMGENRRSFERLRLSPNVLVDVSHLDMSINLLGIEQEHPMLLAPIAYHRLYHR